MVPEFLEMFQSSLEGLGIMEEPKMPEKVPLKYQSSTVFPAPLEKSKRITEVPGKICESHRYPQILGDLLSRFTGSL